MKLHELEKEINEYKRIVRKDWDDGVNYVIKSNFPDSPLAYIDFMQMNITNFTPTISDLFEDVWEVMGS